MAARKFLMATIESSFGTAKTSPVLNTDYGYFRLHDQASFDYTETENVQGIPYGGGINVEQEGVADTVGVKGTFAFLLYPGFWSQILLKWAITRINSGRTTPWPTTDSAGVMPPGDLASLSLYHAFLIEDGTTYDRKRLAGCKCDEWELSAVEGTQGRAWALSGSLTAQRVVGNPHDSSSDPDATEFPAPADTALPTGPFTFGHLATGSATVKIDTNRAATCSALTIRGRNVNAPRNFTGRFLGLNRFVGREVTADVTLRYKASPADRTTYRNQTAADVEFLIDDGTRSIKIDFNTRSVIRAWQPMLIDTGEYEQKLTIINRWDSSTGTDIDLTFPS